MTTGQLVSLPDRADSARFDDDGGAPDGFSVTSASTPVTPSAADGPRLSLGQARGRGSFDGAWWPRSWRLARELPALVAALSAAGDTTARVSVNGDIWTDIPSRVAQTTRPPLRVSWFHTLDPHTVTLGAGNRARTVLLVIPPDTAPEAAAQVQRMAAAGSLSGPSSQILRHAGAVPAPE